MKNNKIWDFLKPIVVLTVIAAVMAALLGGTNLLTKDKIAALEKEAEEAAVKKVIKAESYEKSTLKYKDIEYTYFKAQDGEQIVGYAFTLSSNGYGGAVKSVIGINKDGKITAVEVTDVSNETPGLGQNATKADFSKQFENKDSTLDVVKSNPKENEVKAVTGATITSRAVTNSVNLALELFGALEKEGGK